MAPKSSSQKNEKTNVLVQNEGSIASRLRLRSSSKVGDIKTCQTKGGGGMEDKASRLSKHEKEKCINLGVKIQTENVTKKSSSKPTKFETTKLSSCTTAPSSKNQVPTQIETKKLSSCTSAPSSKNQEKQPIKSIKSSVGGSSSNNGVKGKEKEKPTLVHKQQDTKKPVYHIQWKGFENTTKHLKCSFCAKELEIKEKPEQEHTTDQYRENALQHILFSTQGREDQLSSVLSEVAVLSCSHVFHLTCLTSLHLNDPSCPICLNIC